MTETMPAAVAPGTKPAAPEVLPDDAAALEALPPAALLLPEPRAAPDEADLDIEPDDADADDDGARLAMPLEIVLVVEHDEVAGIE